MNIEIIRDFTLILAAIYILLVTGRVIKPPNKSSYFERNKAWIPLVACIVIVFYAFKAYTYFSK
jgi:hypothetical protein